MLRSTLHLTLVASVSVAGLVFPAPALALAPANADADAMYEQGRKDFSQGLYKSAIEKFEVAYKRSKDPLILYNIGQSYKKLYDDDRQLEYLKKARSALKEYLAAIERHGETALVFFAGAFSHAVRKAAILVPGLRMVDGVHAAEDIGPTTATAAELALAAAALAAVPGRRELLYARVDLVPDDDGQPRLLELELAEPSVFLGHADGASDRFAAAIAGL